MKGITIPAGTHVDIPVYALHHSEEYWSDPWKFVPERSLTIAVASFLLLLKTDCHH